MSNKLLPEWSEDNAIRYGEILAEATGLVISDIWLRLLDIVLWGAPLDEGSYEYRLWWAWKTIVTLQASEKTINDGWEDPYSIVAGILGWDYKDVIDSMPRTAQAMSSYSNYTHLALTVYTTVTKFIDQSDIPYASEKEKLPEVGKWYWYLTHDVPVYVLAHKALPLIDVMVPAGTPVFAANIDQGDGPVLDGPAEFYSTTFMRLQIRREALAKIRLDKAELEY